MEENLHDIDRLFKNKIDDYEDAPSSKLWDALDTQLDKNSVILLKKKYNTLKRIAALLLILLMVTIVYETQFKKPQKNNANNNAILDTQKVNHNFNTDSFKKDKPNLGTIENKNSSTTAKQFTQKPNLNLPDSFKKSPKKITNTNPLSSLVKPINTALPKEITNAKKLINHTDYPKQDLQNNNAAVVKNVPSSLKKLDDNPIKNAVVNTLPPNLDYQKNYPQQTNDLTPPENIAIKKISAVLQNAMAANLLKNTFSEKIVFKNKTMPISKAKLVVAPKLSIAAFYSPQFSSDDRLTQDNNGSRVSSGQPPHNDRDKIKNNEQEQTTQMFGIAVQLNLNKHLGIKSGLNILNKNIAILPQKVFADMDNDGKVKYRFNCSSGYTFIASKTGTTLAIGDSTTIGAATNKLQYIDIPLTLNYKFSVGKFNITPSVGAAINILTKQQISTSLLQGVNTQSENITTIQGLKSSYFSALAGISFDYALSKRFLICLVPTGNFAISSITKNAPVKSYPNSVGIEAGIKINL